MMTFTQKTILTLALLCAPSIAAAAPTNVSHIEAAFTNGQLTVTWAAATDDAGIDFYRVYFSHESILGNDGNYDDFERTAGADTSYTFKSLPLKTERIFVSVLAVNKNSVESEGFETEASVAVQDMPQSSSSSVSSEPAPDQPVATPDAVPMASSEMADTSVPMAIVTVQAVTETGVLVTFTKQVSSTQHFTPDEFVVTDMSGAQLAITDLEISGTTILLHTDKQSANKEYQVAVLQPIPAEDGTNMPTGNPTHFMSFVTQDSSSSESPQQQLPPPPVQQIGPTYIKNPNLGQVTNTQMPMFLDPVSLTLKPMRRSDGTYNVTAQWVPNSDPQHMIAGYSLFTTNDGFQYGRNASVPGSETQVQYTRIPAGVFGVRVATKDVTGKETQGVQKVISLPSSGLGLLGVMAVSGIAAGTRTRRRKSVVR